MHFFKGDGDDGRQQDPPSQMDILKAIWGIESDQTHHDVLPTSVSSDIYSLPSSWRSIPPRSRSRR